MISDEHGGARRLEVVVRIFDLEGYAGGQPHGEFEGSGCGPLCDSVLAQRTKDDGDRGAVECAGDERDICCHQTGEEAGEGHFEGEGVETKVCYQVTQKQQDRVIENCVHRVVGGCSDAVRRKEERERERERKVKGVKYN